jgi:DNA-binding MarR family transcriptional regulator
VASESELEDLIVASIRRVVRAVDLHSRHLVEEHGITAPQLATLAEAERLGGAAIGAIARAVHLSQPTVSGVLDRLEGRGLVHRERSDSDRRSVIVTVTEEGKKLLRESPSLLQDRFREELTRLEGWERYWLLSALQRVAAMMDAEAIKAAPVLEAGPIPTGSGEVEPQVEEGS